MVELAYVEYINGLLKSIKEKDKYIEELEQNEAILSALEAARVDNWEGYGIALDILEDRNGR